jgi:serine/threonine-protein kinase
MEPARHLREAKNPSNGEAGVQADDPGKSLAGDSDIFDRFSGRLASINDLAPGVRISENIRLVSLLRTGGMAHVWIAEHAGLGVRVAVKVMSGELVNDPECVARFGQEAKLAARIKSAHVVNILDYATTAGGLPYIVMELLLGTDLEMRFQAGGVLSFEESSRVLVQICKALAKVHSFGIVHRDIKPENVFLSENDGKVFIKVLDFGIAKDHANRESVTMPGTTMGTPSFMSPEQIFRPKEVDHRSDLWATAVVAYRCLTGMLPFEGDTFGTMCLSINQGKVAAPSTLDPSLPRGLDTWFKKALSIDPAARFQSASDMASAYLAELEKAHVLPPWAVARETDRMSYTSEPGSISERPLVLRRRRRLDPRTVVIAFLVTALSSLATSPERSALFSLVDGWVARRDSHVPLLNPPPDEPRFVFKDPWPRSPAPASPPALATRDIARQAAPAPFLPRKAVLRWPAGSGASRDRAVPPTPLSASAQFGI